MQEIASQREYYKIYQKKTGNWEHICAERQMWDWHRPEMLLTELWFGPLSKLFTEHGPKNEV